MSVTLVCDMCRPPKDSTTHYGLNRYWRDERKRPRHKVIGSIDLCDDCVVRYSHDGRESGHKVATNARRRIEFGRTTR